MALTIVIAFGKVSFVGLDFMELRGADHRLRWAFALWVGVIGLASLVLSMV